MEAALSVCLSMTFKQLGAINEAPLVMVLSLLLEVL